MLRKTTLVSLVIIFMLAAVPGGALAQTVANTSQKGSLLIFPKIATVGCPESESSGPAVVNTVVYLSNDSITPAWLKCYWVYEDQHIQTFSFRLYPNQPVAISACQNEYGSSFGSNASGQLLCWAVKADDTTQISYNHLYGNALIQYTPPAESPPIAVPSAVSYNAWAYRALQNPPGPPGELKLDGINYDASPGSLLTSYVPGESADTWGRPVQAELALALCRQDLRQERTPGCTKAVFSLWNAQRSPLTGAYQCVKSWFGGLLKELDSPGAFEDDDQPASLPVRFKVTAAVPAAAECETTCSGAEVGQVPFVAVMLYESIFESAPQRVPYAAFALEGVDADTTGVIRYDVSGGEPE